MAAGSSKYSDKKILILGGTGFIGPSLIPKLGKAAVTCFHRNRSALSFDDMPVSRIYGDRNNPDDIVRLAVHKYDYIIDLSCTEKTMVKSIEMLSDCCKRYIYISSSSVYDRKRSNPHTESEPPVENSTDEYVITKLEAECSVRSLFPEHTIIRPSKVYGPGNYYFKESEFLSLLVRDSVIVLKNDPILHFTYIDDLTDGIVSLMDHNGTYNIAGLEPAHLSCFISLIAQIHHLPCKFEYAETSDVRFSGLKDCVLDLTKARDTSGYVPRYSLIEGLSKTFTSE